LQSSVIRIIKKRYSVAAALRRLPASAAELASLVGGMPQRVDRMMKTAERGEIQVRADVSGIEQHIDHLEKVANKALICIVGAALIIGAALFFVGFRMAH